MHMQKPNMRTKSWDIPNLRQQHPQAKHGAGEEVTAHRNQTHEPRIS